MDFERLVRARRLFASGEARRMREALGLSIPELAEAAGIPHSTLSAWEAGKHRPRGAPVLRWLDAMERLQQGDRPGS